MGIKFPTSSDYLRMPSVKLPNANQPYTVMLWAMRDSSTSYGAALSLHITDDNSTHDSVDIFNSSYDPRVNAQQSSTSHTSGASTAMTQGVWYHLSMVRFSATDLRLYVNGSQVGSTVTHDVSGRSGPLIDIYVGIKRAVSAFTNGVVESLKIWGRPLEGPEIQREMPFYQPQVKDSLQGWWALRGADDVRSYGPFGNGFQVFGSPTSIGGCPVTWQRARGRMGLAAQGFIGTAGVGVVGAYGFSGSRVFNQTA